MTVRQLTTQEELGMYGEWLSVHPNRSLWQSLEWKKYQESLGKEARIYASGTEKIDCAGLVILDTTTLGLSTWDIPYGPLWGENVSAQTDEAFVTDVAHIASREKCIRLYSSCPVRSLSVGKVSGRYVYPEATLIVDLTVSEEELLAQMKPKGRYNIKVGQKHGITVRESEDIDAFIALHAGTAKRDKFVTPLSKSYRNFLDNLKGSFLLFAYVPGKTEPIAGLLGVIWEHEAIYYYGASDHAHRAIMAPYVLQWETMRFCKQKGVSLYDLFGVAPNNAHDHPWSGVTAFKEKFGGQYVEFPPERQIVLKPVAHNLLRLKRKLIG